MIAPMTIWALIVALLIALVSLAIHTLFRTANLFRRFTLFLSVRYSDLSVQRLLAQHRAILGMIQAITNRQVGLK